MIARVAGERLAKVCLELGGKNPLVVCDDADLEKAAEAAALSAFSNAGQRCAAGLAPDRLRRRLRRASASCWSSGRAAQKVGPADEHDFGPVINERQLESMLGRRRARARSAGATVAHRRRAAADGPASTWRRRSSRGWRPTPRSPARSSSGRSRRCTASRGFEEALDGANASPYGLTAAIWTRQHPPGAGVRRAASSPAACR